MVILKGYDGKSLERDYKNYYYCLVQRFTDMGIKKDNIKLIETGRSINGNADLSGNRNFSKPDRKISERRKNRGSGGL